MLYRGLGLVIASLTSAVWAAAPSRVELKPAMVRNEVDFGTPTGMVDEQGEMGGEAPSGTPANGWVVPSQMWKTHVDGVSAYIDLSKERALASVWVYDTNGKGDLVISAGRPGAWSEVVTYDCNVYKQWKKVPLDVQTRYLRFTRKDGGSNFTEVALYEYASEDWIAVQQQKQAQAQAKAARDAAVAKATAEAKSRPVIDLGEPFGNVTLVDEINVAAANPEHLFKDDPAGASKVETILGKPCRVLSKTPGECAYMTFRVGQYKLLKPGAAYVLEVEYPEDAPRSMVVMNAGNETSRGFHTGAALGDAFHPKYVNNLNESLRVPLSGKYQTWTMFFNLHDRFPDVAYIRGNGVRALVADDGFPVTIAQFSAENIPVSHGAAVSRIRLFEVPDASKLGVKYRVPPQDLPRRHLFWREEMADGVMGSEKEEERGLKDPMDWYRFKADLMQFLGMHTYTKDLLEFGACQHWDSSAGGGNDWVYFNGKQKDWWAQIVKIMGDRGFEVLPYYEYAGSKGKNGLGNQRRAKPLSRDDAYTHIKWVENANADITDPETFADFQKMLDLTLVQFKDRANFIGAWLRPRSQIPMGFGDATRKRFATEANGGKEVTRKQLIDDKQLLAKYETWWFGKRQQFLVAMRDYLRSKGIADATILYTTVAGEPGVGFGTFDKYFVSDDAATWQKILEGDEKDKGTEVLSVQDVVGRGMYLKGLLAPPPTWGGWEWQYASPQSDPQNYKSTEGVLLTHAINRLYTVSSPQTFDAFRGPSGLAVVRHYTLNENMMFNKDDKPKLGYFCADIERAGPHCMMAEAMSMANGDPRFVGYLVGTNYGRGFPKYVRDFNAAFLSLPALPSRRLEGASSDAQVVVRSIPTEKYGTYLAVVNAGMTDKADVEISIPAGGALTDASTGKAIAVANGKVKLTMYPWQLRALHVE